MQDADELMQQRFTVNSVSVCVQMSYAIVISAHHTAVLTIDTNTAAPRKSEERQVILIIEQIDECDIWTSCNVQRG
jgi:hypothetical protein